MEKKENNIEKKDDADDSKDEKNKNSSKKSSLKTSAESHDVEEVQTKEKTPKRKLADFFKKTDSADSSIDHEADAVEDIENIEREDEEYEPNLSEDEVHEAAIVITEARMQDVSEELQGAEPDTVEEYEALANAVFLEELQEIAEGSENITIESINLAFNEAASDLSLDSETIDTMLDIEEEGSEQRAVHVNHNTSNEAEENDNSYEDDQEQALDGSSGSGNGVDYISRNLISNRPNSNPIDVSASSSVYTSSSTNRPTREVVVEGRRSDMLVGAVIGYIVGRRGGRKRAEKRLKPKIDKLEEQVSDLHYEIINKEDKIRTLARQKAEESERIKRLEDNATNISENKSATIDEVIQRRKVKKDIKEMLKKREQLADDPSVEKIGEISLPALKIFHERRLLDGSENSPKRKQVEVMNERELLEKIDGLKINGHDIKKAYLNGQLSQENLRQITKEYLRGGPYKETFMRQFIEKKHKTEKNNTSGDHSEAQKDSSNEHIKLKDDNLNVISKEQAIKQAEALLLTNTQNKKEPSGNRFAFALFTLLFLFVFVLIILLIS